MGTLLLLAAGGLVIWLAGKLIGMLVGANEK
jgi:hypothetical protein